MNCPTCKRTDEFVFEKVSRLWRCDRCHERFRIIPINDGSDRAEEFERAFPTNADRIRDMSDKELAEYIFDLGNGSEYCYGHCAYQDDCATEGLDHDTCIKGVIDWLKQPAKEEHNEQHRHES